MEKFRAVKFSAVINSDEDESHHAFVQKVEGPIRDTYADAAHDEWKLEREEINSRSDFTTGGASFAVVVVPQIDWDPEFQSAYNNWFDEQCRRDEEG